ncbi:hypothetical protein BV25DRAFT_1815271 [Artomyces pyxidatus]|uniref:Uncharacterized protein n=1 Tax=Artomyces pyxidatus TaxID=48021 RepID=A0ACB8SIX3_9AGAM|nr:hypothetical protein BV25DRAFT_1815271 [Artomyces pyxidatus]
MSVQSWTPQRSLSARSPFDLHLYSSSGFDFLSLFSKIATRPNPTITLGPVDMSCSFVVVDLRLCDSPIVYASPSFSRLTGYTEREVLGRNCRFLQSPDGQLSKGDHRQYADSEKVAHLRSCLASNKECQTSLVNFKKGGFAFMNLVTVIPIPPLTEKDGVVFQIGFQVDLKEQSNAISQKLRDGSYMANYTSSFSLSESQVEEKRHLHDPINISEEFRELLEDPAFVAAHTLDVEDNCNYNEGNHPLSLFLLHMMPDFILVLSLKGAFLYVAPAIKRVLGYDPADLVGKNISDYCHPADVVPLHRELKDSKDKPGPQDSRFGQSDAPKSVNLLFRARAKDHAWKWIECTGRLLAEPGKGRKSIILSARPRAMPSLDWSLVPLPDPATYKTEVWGMLSADGTVLFMGANIINILGWSGDEIIGMCVGDLVEMTGSGSPHTLQDALRRTAELKTDAPESIDCAMCMKTGEYVELTTVVYPLPRTGAQPLTTLGMRPIICQLRPAGASPVVPRGPHAAPQGDMFKELDTEYEYNWLLGLEKLRIENQRLRDEIKEIEETIEGQERQIAAVARARKPQAMFPPPMPHAHMP